MQFQTWIKNDKRTRTYFINMYDDNVGNAVAVTDADDGDDNDAGNDGGSNHNGETELTSAKTKLIMLIMVFMLITMKGTFETKWP